MVAGLILGGGPGCTPASGTGTRKPNVILVSFDALRADRLNAYGYRARVTSPHLDALAREGILFENAITASPWTTPAHMSVLTSLTPSRHGMVAPALDLAIQRDQNTVQRLPEANLTLAEALASQGYATAAFTGGVTLDPRIGFDQGFARYETPMFKVGEASFAEMLAWVKSQKRERFFLFWHTFETHFPYLDTSFLDQALAEPTASAVRQRIDHLSRRLESEGYSDRLLAHVAMALDARGALTAPVCDALYAGGVASADRWLGRLLGFLREEGLYDDTLVVVLSDHGEELADHDPARFSNSHGHSVYEELVRVPLVLKLPRGVRAGTRVPEVARLIDVSPTVLDLLSLPPLPDAEGVSLRRMWEGAETTRRLALVEATAFGPELKAIRDARFKLILSVDSQTVAAKGRHYLPEPPHHRELYDLVLDPAEKQNLLVVRPGSVRQVVSQLDKAMRGAVGRELGRTDRTAIDDETVERLRALGYVK
jgi:arylsulfatase A-like enzyme